MYYIRFVITGALLLGASLHGSENGVVALLSLERSFTEIGDKAIPANKLILLASHYNRIGELVLELKNAIKQGKAELEEGKTIDSVLGGIPRNNFKEFVEYWTMHRVKDLQFAIELDANKYRGERDKLRIADFNNALVELWSMIARSK